MQLRRARLDEMSAEISNLQTELATTRAEMEQAERQAGRSEGEKDRLRAQYERTKVPQVTGDPACPPFAPLASPEGKWIGPYCDGF